MQDMEFDGPGERLRMIRPANAGQRLLPKDRTLRDWKLAQVKTERDSRKSDRSPGEMARTRNLMASDSLKPETPEEAFIVLFGKDAPHKAFRENYLGPDSQEGGKVSLESSDHVYQTQHVALASGTTVWFRYYDENIE